MSKREMACRILFENWFSLMISYHNRMERIDGNCTLCSRCDLFVDGFEYFKRCQSNCDRPPIPQVPLNCIQLINIFKTFFAYWNRPKCRCPWLNMSFVRWNSHRLSIALSMRKAVIIITILMKVWHYNNWNSDKMSFWHMLCVCVSSKLIVLLFSSTFFFIYKYHSKLHLIGYLRCVAVVINRRCIYIYIYIDR